jgi:uncharacterized membrane protein YeaQ/YmgE (transglycosylase-associated protein family)
VLRAIIGAIIIGAIIGALGRLILPGRQNISLVMTIGIGIVAAVVGALLLSAFGYDNNNGGIPWIKLIVGGLLAAGGILGYGRISGKSV